MKGILRFPHYVFSENGQIYRLLDGLPMHQTKTSHGYFTVGLREPGKKVATRGYVHRLIAEAFYGPPEEHQMVNHKNGLKHDNRISNLEWVTSAQNIAHAREIGLNPLSRGEQNGQSVLTEEVVRQIKHLLNSGRYGHRELGRMFAVSHKTVGAIQHGKTWKHVI